MAAVSSCARTLHGSKKNLPEASGADIPKAVEGDVPRGEHLRIRGDHLLQYRATCAETRVAYRRWGEQALDGRKNMQRGSERVGRWENRERPSAELCLNVSSTTLLPASSTRRPCGWSQKWKQKRLFQNPVGAEVTRLKGLAKRGLLTSSPTVLKEPQNAGFAGVSPSCRWATRSAGRQRPEVSVGPVQGK